MKKKYYTPMMEEYPLHLSAAICGSGGNQLPPPTPPGTPTPLPTTNPAPARPKVF